MRPLRPFEEYVKDGIIRRVKKDPQRAKSLIKQSERKINSLKETLEKIGIKNENANDYIENCYDIIMYLIRAKLYLEGYSGSGQGAHEAELSYLRLLELSEKDVRFADQMRYFRNGILYYGTALDNEYAELTVEFMHKIHSILMKILKSQLTLTEKFESAGNTLK